MAWRGLHLSRPARLSLADNQIVVAQDDGEVRLPIEDVAWLIVDTPQASFSASLLSACGSAGLAVIFTDARHMPNGMLLPFHTHHRQAAIAAMQVAIAPGLRGRLWQALVQAKILNQGAALDSFGVDASALFAMAARVQRGDPDNVEARAARHYWGAIFADFTRGEEADLRNALLNYGYAVMRGALARALTAAGLLPALGIHHAGQLNAFNLADDLIEPFRPLVDIEVCRLVGREGRPGRAMTLPDRQTLAGILLTPARMGAEIVTTLVATELAAVGLVRAMEGKSARLLALPALAPK